MMSQQRGALLVSSDIHWGQALSTGVADAVVWVWFLACAYTSRFTDAVCHVSCFQAENSVYHAVACVVISALLVSSGWNGAPKAYRATCSLGCIVAVSLLVAVNGSRFVGGPLDIVTSLLHTAFYFSSQILRVETLARCATLRTLLVAVMTSFVTYYLLSGVLLVLPEPLYIACIVAAPLAFLYGTGLGTCLGRAVGKVFGAQGAQAARGNRGAQVRTVPSEPCDALEDGVQPAGRRAWLSPATLLLLLFDVAGGLITAAGGTDPAREIGDLFSKPSTVYLAMALAFLTLGVLVARGHRCVRPCFSP